MDQGDWDFPTDADIEADIEASYVADQASCSAHYWCARFWFYETFVGPEERRAPWCARRWFY